MNCGLIHVLLWVAIVILDRITKLWAIAYCALYDSIAGFITCDLTFNRGISWSMFESSNQIVFYGITAVQIAITMVFAAVVFPHIFKRISFESVGGTLIIAGSMGNIYDRFVHDGVVDFIHFSLGGYSFPIFNCADIAIVSGIFLFLWGVHESSRTA